MIEVNVSMGAPTVSFFVKSRADAIGFILELEAVRIGVKDRFQIGDVTIVSEKKRIRPWYKATKTNITLNISDRSWSFILAYLLKYSLTGVADVRHIDEEFDSLDNANVLDLTIMVDKALPPLTPIELEQIIRN